MYQDFRITTIQTDTKNKMITITANFDIDPDTVNDANVQVYQKTSRNFIGYDITVAGKVVTLNLIDWPEPNLEYVIVVQKLKSILGDELASGIRRKIIFESSITAKLEIIEPNFDEVVTELKLKVKEILASEDDVYTNLYYIELATDAYFHDIKKKLDINKTELIIGDLSKGQYFIRGRVQSGEEYGIWSETGTFILGQIASDTEPIFDNGNNEDSDDEIFTPEIKVVSTPSNGDTPSSLLIEFDCEIDSDFIDNIILIRRTI